jgi:hypothetical protein
LDAAERVLHECLEDARREPDGYWHALATAVLEAAHEAAQGPESVGRAMGVLAQPLNPSGPAGAERVDPDTVARYRETWTPGVPR